eukprot:1609150-Prymnesium_polylepis.1
MSVWCVGARYVRRARGEHVAQGNSRTRGPTSVASRARSANEAPAHRRRVVQVARHGAAPCTEERPLSVVKPQRLILERERFGGRARSRRARGAGT